MIRINGKWYPTIENMKKLWGAIGHLQKEIASEAGGVTSVAGKTGVVTLVKADVGLSNVDNTSDASKPVSTATTTQLNLKAPLASPAFTGTVTGITKDMVGLNLVDNTADLNKPISTLTQTALNTKLTATQGIAQANSTAVDVAGLVTDFNLLLQNLRDHNIIAS